MSRRFLGTSRRTGFLVRLAVAAAVIAAALIWRGATVRSTVKSPRAVALIGLMVLGWLTLSHVFLPRVVRNRWARAAVLAVPAALLVWFFVRPQVVDRRVDEALAGATAVSSGTVRGIAQRGSGDAAVLRLPDGTHVVRRENLHIESSTGPFVYLAPGRGQERTAGALSFDALKGNRGNHNYEVLIWCRAFAVPFANATLTG